MLSVLCIRALKEIAVMLPRSIRKTLRTKIWPFNRKFSQQINAAPAQYRDLVKQIIAESPIWGAHQTIQFPDGFTIKGGRDESRLSQFGLPEDLSDSSVLDIGCNIGAVCIECKKRNAKSVSGLDKNPDLVKCAQGVAKVFDFDINYKPFDIMQDTIDQKYDIVFFLNVFHHLTEKGKIKALRTLDKITVKQMYFEAPTQKDVIAAQDKELELDDYLAYLKGFTTFKSIEYIGETDFDRPLIVCNR